MWFSKSADFTIFHPQNSGMSPTNTAEYRDWTMLPSTVVGLQALKPWARTRMGTTATWFHGPWVKTLVPNTKMAGKWMFILPMVQTPLGIPFSGTKHVPVSAHPYHPWPRNGEGWFKAKSTDNWGFTMSRWEEWPTWDNFGFPQLPPLKKAPL